MEVNLKSTGLWANPNFVKLWTAQTISVFGSIVTGTALPLTAVLVLKARPEQMGLLGAVGALPVLLFGLLAGVWVDRLRRRPVMIAADLGRAVLVGSIPVAYLLGWLRIEHLYVVAFLAGTLTVFFNVADQSFLPAVVEREHLVEANSKLGASGSIAEVGAPALAGTLVQLVTAPIAILIDAISFIFSALFVGLMNTPESKPDVQGPRPEVEVSGLWADLTEGLRLVLSNPLLRGLAYAASTLELFGGCFVVYELFAIQELHMTPVIVGLLVGAGGVGALAGALVAGRVVRRFGLGPTLVGALVLTGGLQIFVPFAGGGLALAALMMFAAQILGDMARAVYFINEVSLRQTIIPDRLLGRANASMHFLVGGVGPVGMLAGGFLAQAAGMRATLLIGVTGMMLASLWIFLSPVRALREQPSTI